MDLTLSLSFDGSSICWRRVPLRTKFNSFSSPTGEPRHLLLKCAVHSSTELNFKKLSSLIIQKHVLHPVSHVTRCFGPETCRAYLCLQKTTWTRSSRVRGSRINQQRAKDVEGTKALNIGGAYYWADQTDKRNANAQWINDQSLSSYFCFHFSLLRRTTADGCAIW